MPAASIQEKRQKFQNFQNVAEELHDDGLIYLWSWLVDFYNFFGVEVSPTPQAEPISNLPDSISGQSAEKQLYYGAAADLAKKIGYMYQFYYNRTIDGGAKYIETGLLDNDIYFYQDPDFPEKTAGWDSGDPDLLHVDGDTCLDTDLWHEKVGGKLVSNFLEDIKVILENKMMTQPDDLVEKYFTFGTSPDPETLEPLLTKAVEAAASYLLLLDSFGFTTKVDIPPPPVDPASSGPIPTDTVLEASLGVAPIIPITTPSGEAVTSTHYIGFLIDGEKSEDDDGYYLPVRYSPWDEKDLDGESVKDWNDENFSYLKNNGELFKPSAEKWNYNHGVILPQGMSVCVTEIVSSLTGVWVGFVIDTLGTNQEWIEKMTLSSSALDHWTSRLKKFTREHTRVLYTRPEYLRKKAAAPPDPLISDKVVVSNDSIKAVEDSVPSAVGKIAPVSNQNWLYMLPGQVELSYYKWRPGGMGGTLPTWKAGQIIDQATIAESPSLRCSEGYYYFVSSDSRRPSESDLGSGASQSNENKIVASKATIESAKEKAWESLLGYLSKETDHINPALYERLYKDHFVLAASRVNTSSTSPGNQKALFAIKVEYIDALPDTRRPYIADFNPNSPTESAFLNGKNFAVAMYANKVKEICNDLKSALNEVKPKIASYSGTVFDDTDQEFEIDRVLEILAGSGDVGDLPTLLADFLRRQAFPRATNQDYIGNLIVEAAASITNPDSDDGSKHIIQIGIKDNDVVGEGVRETISYVLFSPDPKKLKDKDTLTTDFNLFYFDPYITSDEASGPEEEIRRSAVPLRIGLSDLRRSLEGVYPSMALHFLLSHSTITNPRFKSAMGGAPARGGPANWINFLLNYSVPPVKITDETAGAQEEPTPECPDGDLDKCCDEWITQLESATNVWGQEQRILMAKVKNKCGDHYFKKFKKSTPASDPEATRKALEEKSKGLESVGPQEGSAWPPWQLKWIYENLLGLIDVEGIIALIILCIQSKLGIELTAQGICRAALIELIKEMGIGKMEEALLAGAFGDPERYQDLIGAVSNSPTQDPISIDQSFKNAPIATYMSMMLETEDITSPPSWLNYTTIAMISALEQGGYVIELVPGDRPKSVIDDMPGYLMFPAGNEFTNTSNSALSSIYGEQVVIGGTYTWLEIEDERQRLLEQGFTKQDIEGQLVYRGYLKPSGKHFESIPETLQQLRSDLAEATGSGQLGATLQDAEDWLDYILSIINLQEMCELLVGSILEGLEDLLKDPLGFLSGGIGDWWDDFLDALKRKFSFPLPNFKWPDKLTTDTHMGDYGQKLLEMMLSLIIAILSQILNLVIKDALLKCIEEEEEDGLATNPNPPGQPPPSLRIPGINSLLQNETPNLAGGIPFPALSGLMDDLLNSLSPSQLCELLNGTASKQTLYGLLLRIREQRETLIKNAADSLMMSNPGLTEIDAINISSEKIKKSLDSMSDIKSMFVSLKEKAEENNINLDLLACDSLTPSSPMISDVCTAFYDREGRAISLQEAGMTEDEANEQIDSDLSALIGKIAGHAPALFADGINGALRGLPDMCETGGFAAPPGVTNAMNMITDNILDNVKGSLIQDLTAIMYFAVPPRAVLAITDPHKMIEAHELMKKFVVKPSQRRAIAYIGPLNFFPAADRAEIFREMPVYPIIYGTAGMSYGNYRFSFTDDELNSLIQEDTYTKQEIDAWERPGGGTGNVPYYITNSPKELNANYRDVWSDATLTNMGVDRYYTNEETRGIYQRYIEAHPEVENDVQTHNFFKPATFLRLLKEPSFYLFPQGSTKGEGNIKLSIAQNLLLTSYASSNPPSPGSPAEQAISTENPHEFIDYLNDNDDAYERIRRVTYEKFNSLIKDVTLSEMLLELTHIKNPLWTGQKQGHSPNLPNLWQKKRDLRLLRKSHSIHTPLKLIHPDPDVWMFMFHWYVGLPLGDLHYEYMDTLDRIDAGGGSPSLSDTDPSQWSEFGTYIGGSSATQLSGENPPENYNDPGTPLSAGRWRTWAQYAESLKRSPGMFSLLGYAEDHLLSAEGSHAPEDAAAAEDPPTFDNYDFEVTMGHEYDEGVSDDVEFWDDEGEGAPKALIYAFMELTLGEAIGLTDERLEFLYPEFPGAYVDGVLLTQTSSKFGGDWAESPSSFAPDIFNGRQMVPLYVTFKQTFIDPESILAQSPKDMAEFFSAARDPVNEELYEYLSNTDLFPQVLGFSDDNPHLIDPDLTAEDTTPTMGQTQAYSEYVKMSIYNYDSYNPNILKFDLPFTQIFQDVAGVNGTTGFDSGQKIQEIFDTFTSKLTDTDESELSSLVNSLKIETSEDSLVYQNMLGIDRDSLLPQIGLYKDTFRVLKGKLTKIEDYDVPPGPLARDTSVQNALYDYNSTKDVESDVLELIKKIYGNVEVPVSKISENYGPVFQGKGSNFVVPVPHDAQTPRKDFSYAVEPLNFKAQVFGQLMTYKFFEKYEQYSDPVWYKAGGEVISGAPNKEDMKKNLNFVLSTHGFSSLQYAYSNQMFAKLKRSRLHERGFMKQLWDRVLKSGGKGNKNISEACLNIFGQLGMSNIDEEKLNTDFFKIASAKQDIMEYYNKSLCRDVYEKNSFEENAVRMALLQGIVILIVKIYTLEMYIASVIAWDSFNLENVFETDFMVNIIVSNIEKDLKKHLARPGRGPDDVLPKYSVLDRIGIYAKDIVEKTLGTKSEEELAEKLKVRSALAYMIADEGKKIYDIIVDPVDGIFRNGNPISTDLELDILMNSDTDFYTQYKDKVNDDITVNPVKFQNLYHMGDYEYVVDVRFHENIYTLNYGSGEIQDLYGPAGREIHLYTPEMDGPLTLVPGEDEQGAQLPYTGMPAGGYEAAPLGQPVQFTSPAQLGLTTDVEWRGVSFADHTPTYAKRHINMYGFNETPIVKKKKSKNFFHSLPYNYYEGTCGFDTGKPEAFVTGPADVGVVPDPDVVGVAPDPDVVGVAPDPDVVPAPPEPGDMDGAGMPADEDTAGSWTVINPYMPPEEKGPMCDYSTPFLKYVEPSIINGRRDFHETVHNYGLRALGNLGDKSHHQYSEYIKIRDLMITQLGRADGFNKEMYKHTQSGNAFNGNFGNITFQPYVKVVDWTPEEIAQNQSKYEVTLYQENAGGNISIEPCANPHNIIHIPFGEYAQAFFESMNATRNNNIFSAYIYDYIPLTIWSNFYSEIFLKLLYTDFADTMKPFYEKYGFEPFFKEIKFGIRLSYSTTLSVDESIPELDLKEFMRNSFGHGQPDTLGTHPVPAWGLKSSKTFFSHRPYYVDAPPENGQWDTAEYPEAKFKICDELQIPVVEIERNIVSVPNAYSFLVGENNTLISLEKLGIYDEGTHALFGETLTDLSFPQISPETKAAKSEKILSKKDLDSGWQEGKPHPDSPEPGSVFDAGAYSDQYIQSDCVDRHGFDVNTDPNSSPITQEQWNQAALRYDQAKLIIRLAPQFSKELFEYFNGNKGLLNSDVFADGYKQHIGVQFGETIPVNNASWPEEENDEPEWGGGGGTLDVGGQWAPPNAAPDASSYNPRGIINDRRWTYTLGDSDRCKSPEWWTDEHNDPTGWGYVEDLPSGEYSPMLKFDYMVNPIWGNYPSYTPRDYPEYIAVYVHRHEWDFQGLDEPLTEKDPEFSAFYKKQYQAWHVENTEGTTPDDPATPEDEFSLPTDGSVDPWHLILTDEALVTMLNDPAYGMLSLYTAKKKEEMKEIIPHYWQHDSATLFDWEWTQRLVLRNFSEDELAALSNLACRHLHPDYIYELDEKLSGYCMDQQGTGTVTEITPKPPPPPPTGIEQTDLGPYIPGLTLTDSQQLQEMLKATNAGAMKHLTNNFHQFFYKNLAQSMITELKETPEFKLMYNHLFPMKNYMSLSFAMAGDSLSKFIKEPTDVLRGTKNTLFQIMKGIENSLDYTFIPEPIADFLENQMPANMPDTMAQDPNMSNIILWIIIRTSLLILKGFVEVTDPAIALAKAIIMAANAIQQAIISALESGVWIAKQSAQAAIAAADMAMLTIESTMSGVAVAAKSAIDMYSTVVFDPGNLDADPPIMPNPADSLKDYIEIEVEESFDTWVLELTTPPWIDKLDSEPTTDGSLTAREKWDKMAADMKKLQDAQKEYKKAKKKKESIQTDVMKTIKNMEEGIAEAKEELRKVFASPYLLPGLWAAMIPSMMPWGGGIMPPPLPGGPSSTIPGMIYLALIFVDQWEQNQHDEFFGDDDPNCDDYL